MRIFGPMAHEHNEHFKFRLQRHLKDAFWFATYALWCAFSPHRYVRLPEVNSVLVVAARSLGDLLVSTPVFRALKRRFGRVDVLVKSGLQQALAGNPHVDDVVTKVDKRYDLGVML